MPGQTINSEAAGETLFSLELVVEKVYLPHTPCRFPAIAFRLLDFPTIVISHVEKELEIVMRKKISLDPDYQLPDQFTELKDRSGNFMVKKGKSCLFKMSADVLKQHLTSTPLYVMVLDMFPETPKLVGNSTVPLNMLMESICGDIARLGATVPSAHGDKGLFKLYNLMGKEMGYFVVGYRLLCLGPSLIHHLPASSLMQRANKNVKNVPVDDMMIKSNAAIFESAESSEPVLQLRNSACMTDPIRHDVLLQTVELEDKAIHVEIHQAEPQSVDKQKVSSTIATQTQKIKAGKNSQNKWMEKIEHKIDDDDIIINNIVCPPPLFYNSEAAPPLEIERQSQSFMDTDMSLEDLSDIESFDGHGIHTPKPKKTPLYEKDEKRFLSTRQPEMMVQKPPVSSQVPQARAGELIKGLQVAPQASSIFPLLTALISELSCIQDPNLLLNISNNLQATELKRNNKQMFEKNRKGLEKEEVEISPAVVSAVAEALKKKLDDSKDNIKDSNKETEKVINKKKADRSQSKSFQSKTFTPAHAKKNKMLAFGITNTQRLRLQKTNPGWLKKADEEAEKMKSKKQPAAKNLTLDDMNATTFSDTLTEVRRLAEKELESTAGGDTLRQIASEVEDMNTTLISSQKAAQMQLQNKVARESSSKHKGEAPQPKARTRIRQKVESEHNNLRDSSDSDDIVKKKPVPLEKKMRDIPSPAFANQDAGSNGGYSNGNGEYDEGLSARSDLPSSRSRSIEVHLPSAQVNPNDSDTDADDDSDIPLPDESLNVSGKSVNLPQYIARTASLPDSIDGIHNESLNVSGAITENSPMESTRHSKNMTDEQNVMQSTDYDSRQFHSTEEPELQGLVSDEENPSGTGASTHRSAVDTVTVGSVRTSQKFPIINPQASESSPVPSVRRSTTKLDTGGVNNSYLPSVSLSRGQGSPKGQGSPVSSRPGTPTKSKVKSYDLQPKNSKPAGMITPRSNKTTPRSPAPSPKRPVASRKKPLKSLESIHTESLSSYMPSDPDNMIVSLSSSGGGVYSDDFQDNSESLIAAASVEKFPKIIPSTKLGYTVT